MLLAPPAQSPLLYRDVGIQINSWINSMSTFSHTSECRCEYSIAVYTKNLRDWLPAPPAVKGAMNEH
jgi:hypothetical protein